MIDVQFPFRSGACTDPAQAREVARLLGEGLLVPVLFDVVAAASLPIGQAVRARALWLVVPQRLHERETAVAQQAAAWLWRGGPPPAVIDVVTAKGKGRAIVPHLMLHERTMPAVDVAHVPTLGGPPLAVTTGARTAADLLRTLPPPTALDDAVEVARATGTVADDVAACLDLMPRARGVARARRLLASWPAGAG